MANDIHCGYVIDSFGVVWFQYPDDNVWGFTLTDGDIEYPGGFGVSRWTAIAHNDNRITDSDRSRLSHYL